MPEKISHVEWEKIEENVNEAEKSKRKIQLDNSELYTDTGLSEEERSELGKDKLFEKEDIGEISKILTEEQEELSKEVEELLGPEDSPERALIELRRKNLFSAIRENRKIEIEREKLLEKEAEVSGAMGKTRKKGGPVRGKSAVLKNIREGIDGLKEKKEKLLESSPEAFFGIHLQELKKYGEAKRIVETPHVKEQAEDIVAHFKNGEPVFIYGHLGAGKTELAMHIARNYLQKEALVISGSKHTSLAELYGHQVLAIDKIEQESLEKFTEEVETKFRAWAEKNPKATEDEKNRTHDTFLQTYLTKFKGGTISDFFMGPIYRAMEEGRPIIIDEVNAIPHEILISLNHILTRKAGEEVPVQQNSGRRIVIQEGYGVMMTGNLNQGQEKYKDREDMDPAFLDRLYKKEYDYLPQAKEGNLEDEAGADNELFAIMLAKVMDKNGNMELPKGGVEKLWKLAEAGRVMQDVFAGREVDKAYYYKDAGGKASKYFLKESVFSMRSMNRILDQWQGDDFKQELDYYIWQNFVSQGTDAHDRSYMYQLLKDQYGFFKSDGWEQNPNYGAGFNVEAPKNRDEEKEFHSPRETVEYAFGKAPKRAQWPEVEKGETKEKNIAELQELEEFGKKIEQEIAELEKGVADFCSIEPSEAVK